MMMSLSVLSMLGWVGDSRSRREEAMAYLLSWWRVLNINTRSRLFGYAQITNLKSLRSMFLGRIGRTSDADDGGGVVKGDGR